MKSVIILAALALSLVSQAEEKVKAPHCKAIAKSCKDAGFKAGDWKNGDGLVMHCLNPILGRPLGPKAPAMKAGLTVPVVSASDVQACLSENPNFGKGKSEKK
jgi:hypothetical protein